MVSNSQVKIKKFVIAIILLLTSINLMASCGEKDGYQIALKKAIQEHPVMKKSTVYDYKAMRTAYGYAYTIYFNRTTDATNADMLLVTMNNNCKILHVTAPAESTFYLKSKSKCTTKGTIVGDNHELLVNSCGKNIQFKASNDALSRNFTKNEVSKIKKIFDTAKSKYSTFSDRQVLYRTNGLKIWVRLYSSSRWFLVFDFESIAPYPASTEASVWIESEKFKVFERLLK